MKWRLKPVEGSVFPKILGGKPVVNFIKLHQCLFKGSSHPLLITKVGDFGYKFRLPILRGSESTFIRDGEPS